MGEPIDDGGPAFARPRSVNQDTGETIGEQEGMSLRDWFAGKVLPAVSRLVDGDSPDAFVDIAREAYRVADAMVAQSRKAVSGG